MSNYNIANLEKLSGIKAHTIRIWEQRFNLLNPLRTETNIRYYDDNQLRKLLNTATLIKNGFKISEISKLSEQEVYAHLQSLYVSEKTDFSTEMFINELVTSGLSYNEYDFEKIFSTCLLRFGLEGTYTKIIYPLLERLGLMWSTENIYPAQEHFILNLIKQKIFTAIDGLHGIEKSKKSFVLFLQEDEEHEIGLLMANYLLRLKSIKVIYLGQRVPVDNLKNTVDQCNPTHLMTFLTHMNASKDVQNYINKLSSEFEKQTIFISGNSILEQIHLPKNVIWMRSIKQLKEVLV